MKIVMDFTGTSGTGKTTIMEGIKPFIELKGFRANIVESSSRYFMNTHKLKLYDKMEDPDSGLMGYANIASIFQSILRYDFTLCTDFGIRGLVYASYSKRISRELIDCYRYMMEYLKSDMFRSQVYPIWIYLPLEISKEDYDIAGENAHRGRIPYAEQKKICNITRYTLESFKLPYYVLTGNIEERQLVIEQLVKDSTWMVRKGFKHKTGGYLL